MNPPFPGDAMIPTVSLPVVNEATPTCGACKHWRKIEQVTDPFDLSPKQPVGECRESLHSALHPANGMVKAYYAMTPPDFAACGRFVQLPLVEVAQILQSLAPLPHRLKSEIIDRDLAERL